LKTKLLFELSASSSFSPDNSDVSVVTKKRCKYELSALSDFPAKSVADFGFQINWTNARLKISQAGSDVRFNTATKWNIYVCK